MSNDRCRIFVMISFYFLHLDASCIKTRLLSNSNLTQIFSENFFSGQSLSSNITNCSLIIESRSNGFFIFTTRVFESENEDFPSELTFITEEKSVRIHSRSQRVSIFIASESLTIVYRSQHSRDRFLLESTFVDRIDDSCPDEWKCNCQNECENDRFTCPFCSLGTTDQCRSNEIWCLPSTNHRTDQRGFCVRRDDLISCSQSTRLIQCDRIIPFYDQDGFVTEDNLIIGKSLCLVLNSRMPIDFKIHQNLFIDLITYHQNSSIIIRMVRSNRMSRLNLTWSIRHCPDGQILCSDQDERRCYSSNQRCDGQWNCFNGDDELACSLLCPSSFLCPDLHHQACFSASDRCNGYPICSSRFDEEFCSSAQCNSNNGSYLCRNNRCIYESWRCDGSNDCGDNSDEEYCPLHPHRRVITATVIGVVTFSILLLLVLSCSCKLFSVRRSFRFFHRSTSNNNENSDQPLAPPSYNQTIGLTDEQDERLALLMDHLRLAGFAEVISVSQSSSSTHGRPLLNRESPPAYIPSEQTHPSSDTDDEKMLMP